MQMTRTGRLAVTLTTLAMSMALTACDGGEGVRAAAASGVQEGPASSRGIVPWDPRAPVWPDEHCRHCTVAAAIRSRYAPAAGEGAAWAGRAPSPRAAAWRASAQRDI
jgi:hypothetical protein